MMLRRREQRPGTILIEAAFVYPIVFLIILGIIVLGLGVFRFQQVAHISREASRWAAVHGAQYAKDTGNPAATATDVYTQVIKPQAVGMDLANITYSVTWNTSNAQTTTTAVTDPATGTPSLKTTANTVTVTVTYTWNTGIFGSLPVSSTSVRVISY